MSMNSIPSVYDLTDIAGKRVLVRASFDVPLENGVVKNSFRIKRGIATLTHLKDRGAIVIILTHIGRNPETTTKPLVAALREYINVTFVPDLVGEVAHKAISTASNGSVVLLQNLRSNKGEEMNDDDFAKSLASLGDYYVDDAFAVAHRAHASIVGIPKYLPSFAGITFLEEYNELTKVLEPKNPSLFIIGGAKFETKEPLIKKYAEQYTNTFIGGALANDFLKGKGYEVGESLLSPVDLTNDPLVENESVIIPIDVVAVHDGVTREVLSGGVLPNEKILDVGSKTIECIAPYIQNAKTILWNGPLGNYEGGYGEATQRCAGLIAQSDAYSVVGGGDTVAAIEALGLQDSFGFLSTAGGAMLHFLEYKTLPGIEALQK